MNIENESIGEVRVNMVSIKYDYVPKYCWECKMQGHNMKKCRASKVSKDKEESKVQHDMNEHGGGKRSQEPRHSHLPQVHKFQKGKARILSNGKVVGDPGQWNVAGRNIIRNNSWTTQVHNRVEISSISSVAAIDAPTVEQHKRVEDQQVQEKEEVLMNTRIAVIAVTEECDKSLAPYSQHNEHDRKDESSSTIQQYSDIGGNKDNLIVGDNNRVIVLLPIVVQTNESQMVIPQKEFPNKVLHDIISHNKDEKELVEIEIPKQHVEAPMEGGNTENAMLHITRSNLSPRVMEAARKDEKIGGLFMVDDDHEDFECCILSCNLSEVPYKGSPFTWWNGRADNDFIFERLDRIVINKEMQSWFNHTEVEHLPRTGLDHSSILPTCEENNNRYRKPFRFLKFWTEHDDFKFSQERDATEFSLLRYIPNFVALEEKLLLCKIPDLEEVKKVVWALNGDSASGPDGLKGRFYQCCWDITGNDILTMA
ncbi:hypothetical protein FXO38_27005 [Capsicum annuum]|nr:hypothetical protein FXO38_27005 [Capsicum annuum]